jgi:hypothetical protein
VKLDGRLLDAHPRQGIRAQPTVPAQA